MMGLRSSLRWVAGLLALAGVSAILVSCGGGGAVVAGGVGTGGTGVIAGTVTGFGSIILDGKPVSSATGQYLGESSSSPALVLSPQRVTLGQNLEIQLDASGNPTTVQVNPELVGQVSAISSASTLVVNGMTVAISPTNASAPATFYIGYSGFASIRGGDWVRVYGSVAYDAQGNPYVLATQIRQISANPGYIRVSGPLQNLSGNAFQVNGLSFSYQAATAYITPTGASTSAAALSNGTWVNVWSTSSASPWMAGQIQIDTLSGGSGSLTLSGVVAQTATGQTLVGGLPVRVGFLNALTQGQYVTVQGTLDGVNGVLDVQSATPYAPSSVSLSGTIAEMASPGNFTVRGTSVITNGSTQFLSGSGVPVPATSIQENVYVQVQGTSVGNNILANVVTVSSLTPTNATVDYLGTVTAQSGGGFTLTLLDATQQQVTLLPSVAYGNGTAANLVTGALVEVEGTQTSSGTLAATGISFWLLPNGAQFSSASFQASGVVYNDNPANSTFTLNGMTIQIGPGVTLPPGFGNGASVDVLLNLVGNQMVASYIVPDDAL